MIWKNSYRYYLSGMLDGKLRLILAAADCVFTKSIRRKSLILVRSISAAICSNTGMRSLGNTLHQLDAAIRGLGASPPNRRIDRNISIDLQRSEERRVGKEC